MSPRSPGNPARRTGRRTWRDSEFAVLDFETTGLDPSRDDIVSFGVVPVLGGRAVMRGATYQEVSPVFAPSPASVRIHGLRRADLEGAPRVEEAGAILREAIHGRIIVAWAAQVEAAFLAGILGRSPRWWRRRIVDTLDLAREVDRRERVVSHSYNLTTTASRFGVPVFSPHDALDDALTTAQLFLVLATKLSSDAPRSLWWLRRMRRPRLLPEGLRPLQSVR
jgi:DNA polymerase III subunit epsilon